MSESLQNKLSQYEAKPSPGLWDKIEAALDVEQDFAKRLYQYEEVPRKAMWENIEASIDEPGTKVIPFSTRFKKPIRYVAAASVIAVILITTTLLRKNVTADNLPVESASLIPYRPKQPVNTNGDERAKPEEQKVQQPSFNPSINSTPGTEVASVSVRRKPQRLFKPLSFLQSVSLGNRFIPENIPAESFFNFAASDEYMIYSDDDGKAMKVPKKLISFVNCPDGDGSCKERIRQLQQKLSASNMTADFSGLVEMIRQLQ